MSLTELFSQRYQARVGCGELFEDDLHLHDRRALREKNAAVHLTDEDAYDTHVTHELALRVQINKAINTANDRRTVKDLPRKARQMMADAYLQANRADWSAFMDAPGFENLFQKEGTISERPPLKADKFTPDANLLIFDYVEAFFDLLPSEEQLEFSRDLNQRLQRGASRWYFQLGRWRRDDWPRERDSQFDLILVSLKKQADLALEAHENRALKADGQAAEQVDSDAASQALMSAARSLWEADRLLASDLLSGKVRHGAAVRAARQALDQCLTHFRGMVRGPFIRPKPPKDVPRSGFLPLNRAEKPASKTALKGVEEPVAAGLRLKQLGHWLAYGGAAGVSKEDRLAVLERANLAEFMARLILFGLPETEAGDVEEAEADEVRRYSRLTNPPQPVVMGGRRFSHGQGALPLELSDEATARLAVDVLARLCQFSTGAASATGEPGFSPDRDPMVPGIDHPRQADTANARRIQMLIQTLLVVLGVSALVGVGVLLGLVLGGASPLSLLGVRG